MDSITEKEETTIVVIQWDIARSKRGIKHLSVVVKYLKGLKLRLFSRGIKVLKKLESATL